jgi:hypothetical protein
MTLRGAKPANFEAAEMVLDPADIENNLFADGRFAELLNRDSSNQVSYEGSEVTWRHQMIMRFVGAERVGRFRSIPTASDDLKGNELYPQIQRGTYTDASGDEQALWWDPYYVTVDDPGPDGPTDCPPGVFYSPRNSDPRALIPDLQDYIAENLPDAIPDLNPLDRNEGWAYVNVPLNFTVPESSRTPVQATAYVQDPTTGETVWAQATATPIAVVFLPDDGTPSIYCDLEDAELAYDPATPGPCSHTYVDSSNTKPGGVYQAALSVQWVGEFNASNIAEPVQFSVPPSWSTFDLMVAEARPAVSYSG